MSNLCITIFLLLCGSAIGSNLISLSKKETFGNATRPIGLVLAILSNMLFASLFIDPTPLAPLVQGINVSYPPAHLLIAMFITLGWMPTWIKISKN